MKAPIALQPLRERFARMAKRERMLVFAATLAGIVMLGNALLIEPQAVAAKAARAAIQQLTTETGTITSQLTVLRAQLQSDPDAARKAELASLRGKLDAVGARIASRESVLVPPERMNQLLETLVRQHAALRLVSLKSLPPVSVLASGKEGGEAKPVAREFDLFRHGVELRVEGSYADLYAYLQSLERNEQKMLWQEVKLNAEDYPLLQLHFVVHTLSADRAWLKI